MITSEQGPLATRITQKLTQAFEPTHLTLRDDSAQHAGHMAMQQHESPESHFYVQVVSQ